MRFPWLVDGLRTLTKRCYRLEAIGGTIPQNVFETIRNIYHSQRFCTPKQVNIFIVASLEVVIGDSVAKMMNVMVADIGGKPLENGG